LAGCLAVFTNSGCEKSDAVKAKTAKPEKEIVEFLGNNSSLNRLKIVHLSSDTVYTLTHPLVREDGEQLIIDEGTLIKAGTGSMQGSITINPGGLLVANGSAANPIVFTSMALPGTQGTTWGGITLIGNAPSNTTGEEGNADDFSGSLRFVRIEFAPLVLQRAGSRTLLENVQVSYAGAQASFEFDGGNVNARNLVSYACGGGADFYITGGYRGKMQNVLAYRHPFFGAKGNRPFEALAGLFIENSPFDPEARPQTFPAISNLTVIGPNEQNGMPAAYNDTTLRSAALVATGNSLFHIRNAVLSGYATAWYMDDEASARNLHLGQSQLSFSVLHSYDSLRIFYLKPNTYMAYTNQDFKDYVMDPLFNNKIAVSFSNLMLERPFQYQNPDPKPTQNSPLLSGASFSTPPFDDPFFRNVPYIGAMGTENWLQGWVNFTPLKTDYNYSK
jgi:hypothetical protein